MTPHSSGAKRTAGYSVYAIGLIIALSGLANVMPTYNVLPRIGPFPVEWFRPLFYWLSILVFLAADAERRAGRGRLSPLHLGAYAVAAVVVSYVCYDYYRIGQIIANSVIFFGPREMYVALAAAALSLWACWILWGAPIAVLGGLALLYLATGQYWPGPLRTAPSDIYDTISANIWYDSDQGILGSIMGVVLTTVLPFIILGAILEGCGAGGSMIRISFHLMKKFKGGPAYAAILASALFGTVSGSAVANVVGTGVVTIPMIRKRGFNANFAGAVEATASTGGQILPPIMGAAALVMADIVGVSYLTVVLAVIIPAVAYYLSLFLAVYFEAQKLDIQVGDDDVSVPPPALQDWVNLVLVFGPIFVIVWLLVSGLSAAGASIAAILLLVPLSFINPQVRRKPQMLIAALAEGGKTIGQLAVAIAIVGIVVSTLSATGVPTSFAVLLSTASGNSLLIALLIAAAGCIILGMGMPTLPAYIAIISVMGPTLQGFGMDLLAAHMFVFFFGVAAGITPPVALTAFAAASVSGGRPIATAVASTRIGAMMFLIPFAWAFDDALLLGIGETDLAVVIPAIFFLLVALYFCTSALIGFDRGKLSLWERLARLGVTIALLTPMIFAELGGLAIGLALVAYRHTLAPKTKETAA
ncbi:TRAP transporter permease DctM/Q [Pacificitalea manganoxidans]|uniref:TRAP transporter permease DctM/Q n=1 Tax=Pacificitalea manganoxidans TaxID=1411902 RepID=A0A291LYK1_9RHOB|nr:TRAP transporter fused permease subunit [Pacificitalea manganoxidans]ATI41772.1 TRAP transporter permease DctM/Q [Pacificitalea manganoxidans]MDR6309236.1 TRAP transporter 4TM/12TM fusion protein [Pacificitalea manganoxidans]